METGGRLAKLFPEAAARAAAKPVDRSKATEALSDLVSPANRLNTAFTDLIQSVSSLTQLLRSPQPPTPARAAVNMEKQGPLTLEGYFPRETVEEFRKRMEQQEASTTRS